MYATRLFISVVALVMTLSFARAVTLSGPGYTDLVFDGLSTYVTIPSDASVLAGKSLTFEAWVFVPRIGNQMPIVSRINSSTPAPTDAQNDFVLQINENGYVILVVGGLSETIPIILPSSSPIVNNNWYHIAFTIDYLNEEGDSPYRAVLYVDSYDNSGKIDRDVQTAYWYGPGYTRIALTNEVITVGKYINSQFASGIFFHGSIDEVRLWSGARTGADIQSYSKVSIDNWRDAKWALTENQGGFSSNQLIVSFNLNNLSITLDDQSPQNFDATIHGGYSVGANSVQFLQYVLANGEVPLVVKLYALDATTISNTNAQFFITWVDSELQGEVYNYAKTATNASSTQKTNPLYPYDIRPRTGLGVILKNGSQVDTTDGNTVVYIVLPSFLGTNARFRYYSIINGAKSASTEVRITIDCPGNRSAIDNCGICNGNNTTCRQCIWDACGVCNGTNSTCKGCDGVPNSGLEIDRCGVCGGQNLCLGCDHMGGGVKDACGVCNGDNSTCGECSVDACGILCGDGSSCSCSKYHGYHVQEMDYLLLKWGLTNALANIDKTLAELDESLSLLQGYEGDADIAAMVMKMNEFSKLYLLPYDAQITEFYNELNQAIGNTE